MSAVAERDQGPVVVVGAGAAGLAAALLLARAGRPVVVAEQADGVGGLARTVERDGYRFDLGGHRFFTQVPEVRALWEEMLGPDLLVRRRRSRVLFHGRAFDYPLGAGEAGYPVVWWDPSRLALEVEPPAAGANVPGIVAIVGLAVLLLVALSLFVTRRAPAPPEEAPPAPMAPVFEPSPAPAEPP